MKKLILIAFLCIESAFAVDLGYRYDWDSGLCINSSGKEGRNTGNLDECGESSEINFARQKKYLEVKGRLSQRGLKIEASVMTKVNFSKANLVGAQFESVDLKTANFTSANLQRAKFLKADLTGANFALSDLRAAIFDSSILAEVKFDKAVFDERTKLPFDCRTAFQKGMKFISPRQHYCVDQRPTALPLSSSFKKSFPDVSVVISASAVDVYSDTGFAVRPFEVRKVSDEAFGLSGKNYIEILCALKMGLCENNARALKEMYKIKRIPKPILFEGIELYHANTKEAERAKKIRWIGFFEIFQKEPAELKNLLDRVRQEVKRHNAQFNGEIRFRSRIQDIQDLKVDFNFLPELTKSGCALVRVDETQRIKCRAEFEVAAPEVRDIGWLQQVMNAMIRRAFGFTLTLHAETFEEIREVYKGGFRALIPILYLNTQAIEWQLLQNIDPRGKK